MGLNHMRNILLKKIETVYQPIWNMNNSTVLGFEALLRFPDGFCRGDIEKAFELAREEGILFELDTRSVTNAVSSFPLSLLKRKLLLFINIYPSTLIDQRFEPFIMQLVNKYPQIQEKIVFELSETKHEEAKWDLSEIKQGVSLLKENGFHIALDDVGKGTSGLQKIIEFSPNYIKLDRYFSKELFQSKEKQQMISLLIQYSKGKMGLILEGIELEADLEKAKALNVQVVQGYLLGRPKKLTAMNVIQSFFPPSVIASENA